jgi:hypothetical protein
MPNSPWRVLAKTIRDVPARPTRRASVRAASSFADGIGRMIGSEASIPPPLGVWPNAIEGASANAAVQRRPIAIKPAWGPQSGREDMLPFRTSPNCPQWVVFGHSRLRRQNDRYVLPPTRKRTGGSRPEAAIQRKRWMSAFHQLRRLYLHRARVTQASGHQLSRRLTVFKMSCTVSVGCSQFGK